ncbi:MAG: bla regulator protein blaR1, partial [Clostridiales bacterium]|nr:bla regulator protein blaR1 [Clostridiales bacterium]
YSAKWIKWIWLMLAIRLLVPIHFAPFAAPFQLNLQDTDGAQKVDLTSNVSLSDPNLDSYEKAERETTKNTMSEKAGKQENRVEARKLSKRISWVEAMLFVWMLGCVIFIFYHLVGYWHYKRQILRWSHRAQEQNIQAVLSLVTGELSLAFNLEVLICDRATSPLLLGFIHPKLVIPIACYTDQELYFIMKHELSHFKRGDIWYKFFFVFVNAVHWFNPTVYLLRKESYLNLEMVCDDEVVRNMSLADRKRYGEVILSCIRQQKMRRVDLLTGFNDTKTLKMRLKNIMDTRRKRNGILMLLFVLIIIAGMGTLLSVNGKKQKNTGSLTWYGENDLRLELGELPDLPIKNSQGFDAFLKSDSTLALLAVLPEADIRLFGRKENGLEDETYTLHGLYVMQGKEIQRLDTDWGVYGELPTIEYQDFDRDGEKELALIVKSSSGTNLSINDLHILEKKEEGGWTDHVFTSLDWQKIVNDKVKYQVEEGILSLTYDGEDMGYQIDLATFEEEWGERLTSVFFGSIGEFVFQNGTIYLKTLPTAEVGDWVTPQFITEDYIQFNVLYQENFELILDNMR